MSNSDAGWFVPRRPFEADTGGYTYGYTESYPEPSPDPEVYGQGPYDAPGADSELADADAYIRPFIITGGRTSPLADGLRLETLIRALPAALSAPLAFEARRVVELCQQPCSVAEIAAAMRVPVGVARVVIGDLLAGNLVFCHETPRAESMPVHTIERIRDLVRAL
ncbi:DUF742 domain-containing protein [Yinghuangia soli]|uniref:DUF742 domain-containing protein n=1 Tax=Yinghuangia soli TaxID=2908204 RepID=A0AA41U5P3_9ACTN|nr:DUF742 domain-containing protein [Yinghuangia soli]MCF2532142.1 DUF742 domain-containing protein [Yinghuangia soli]